MRFIGALAVLCLVNATAAPAAERFAPLDPDRMTPEQKKVADDIVSGPRKSLSGPFNAWLRSPQLADRLQRVGEYLRFHSSVPARLNEFAILITARQWTAQYEWYAHYPLAIKAGLDPRIATELATGKRPEGSCNPQPQRPNHPLQPTAGADPRHRVALATGFDTWINQPFDGIGGVLIAARFAP